MIADLRPIAEQMAAAPPYEYPSVLLVIPEAKPSTPGPYRIMQGLGRDPFSVHCLCEFQYKSDRGSVCVPLWHPVFHTTGPFSLHLSYPAEFVRRMGAPVKSVMLALKYGQIGATIAGVPVPDMASLIPADLFSMPGHACESSMDSLPASDEDVVEAIQTGKLAASSLRPSSMGVGQVDVIKSHFGQVQVRDKFDDGFIINISYRATSLARSRAARWQLTGHLGPLARYCGSATITRSCCRSGTTRRLTRRLPRRRRSRS